MYAAVSLFPTPLSSLFADEDRSQNSSQEEERLSIKNEDSSEKRLTAKSEFKKSKKPKLAESNRADDKTDTKSTTSMQNTLGEPEQMKTSSLNEQTDSDTLKKQAPVANALESKVLTESELHADQMIKKYIGQDRVVALLDTPEEAEKKRLKAEMTEKLKKEKAAERTKKKAQKGLERQKVKNQKAEKKRLSLEKKNEKVKAKKFVSAQNDGSNKEVVQVKTKETKPKNVAEKTETESKAELDDFEDAVKNKLAAKKVPANENIAYGEVVSEKQETTDVDMVSDNPTEDETTGDKVKDEQQAITTDQRASEVPEKEKVTKVISEEQKGSKSDTEAIAKAAKLPKVKADTKTSDGKKEKKSIDKPSKKQKAEKKTPKPSEKTISEEKPKKKKVPKLTKPTLPAIGGDVKKPATGDLTSSAGVIKPKFKAPKKKSLGFQAPTKATKQSSGEKSNIVANVKSMIIMFFVLIVQSMVLVDLMIKTTEL
ncbi:transcriptional regulator ATRX homolog [Clytia hemisphaerica]